jgi:hypothetical protein
MSQKPGFARLEVQHITTSNTHASNDYQVITLTVPKGIDNGESTAKFLLEQYLKSVKEPFTIVAPLTREPSL